MYEGKRIYGSMRKYEYARRPRKTKAHQGVKQTASTNKEDYSGQHHWKQPSPAKPSQPSASQAKPG